MDMPQRNGYEVRHILFFNQEAEKITGYRREEVLGKDCHDVFGTPFCGEHCAFCGDEIQVKDKKEYTIAVHTRSGDLRRVEVTVTVMRDEQGEIFGVLSFLRDTTDLFCPQIRADQVTATLIKTGGNKAKVAILLGVGRATL